MVRHSSAPAKLGRHTPRRTAALAQLPAAHLALALAALALAALALTPDGAAPVRRWAHSGLAAALDALEPASVWRWAADGLAAAQGALERGSSRLWTWLWPGVERGSALEPDLGAQAAFLLGALTAALAVTFTAVAVEMHAGAPLVRTSFTARVLVQDLRGAPSTALKQLADVLDRVAAQQPSTTSRDLEGFLCILDDPSSVADRSEARYALGVRLDGLARDEADQLAEALSDLGFFERHFGTSPVLAWATADKGEGGALARYAFLKFVRAAAEALRKHVPNSSDPARAGGPASPFPACVVRSSCGATTFYLPLGRSSVVFRTSSLPAPRPAVTTRQ